VVTDYYQSFEAAAARFASQTAVEVQRSDRVDRVTYAALRNEAERVAALLSASGVAAGDRCVLLADNSARWCAAYLGILRLGGVALPFDTAYRPTQIATLLEDSGARVIFSLPRYLPAVQEAAQELGLACLIILLQGAAPGCETLDEALVRAELVAPPTCQRALEDPAVILYTSGTTSDPKGVVLTHGNLLGEIEAIRGVICLDHQDCVLGVLPLFHALAQVANLLLPLVSGSRVVFLESVNTTEILRALDERNATAFCCVPQFFYLLHKRIEQKLAASGVLRRAAFRALLRTSGQVRRLTGINIGPYLFRPVHRFFGKRMRILVTGGSRFDSAVGRDLHRMGFDLLQAYGLTECTGGATVTRLGETWTGSVGKALPGVEVKILASGSSRQPGNGEGEVLIRGPIVMQGYYNRPDANAETLREGWLHTGDLGRFDRKGRLFITGRKKDVIVLGSGKNIYPEDVEAHYLQSPYIKEMCVVGWLRPGEPSSERLHAVVVPDLDVLRRQKIVNAREIIRFEIETLSVQLPSYKHVLSFDIWQDELPRTTTRKLKRFEILERIRNQSSTSAEASPEQVLDAEEAIWATDPVVAPILSAIDEFASGRGPLRPAANLEIDLGLDSMERVELFTHLERVFEKSIPEEVSSRVYTVRELVDAVRATPPGKGTARLRAALAWDDLLHREPPQDPAFASLLKPRPFLSPVLFLVIKTVYFVACFLFRFRVRGREHLPQSGPFLICPNHQSYIDPFLLASALPFRIVRDVFFVGASEFFASPVMQRVARLIHLIPVDPDSNLVRAMQAGAFGLRNGKVLVLFPEGERSIDGSVRKFKKGASILATHMQVPVVPVALDGPFKIWPRGRAPQRLGRVRMHFGEPLPPPQRPVLAAAGVAGEQQYTATIELLRSRVEELWHSLRLRKGVQEAVGD